MTQERIPTTRPSAPVTLHDVAREAGVSLATASRALNGSARKVAEPYRIKVLEAATRLRYSPNISAQAVARGSTNTVALLVADITDPYFSAIAAGVVHAAEEAGLIVTMSVTERRPERELEIVGALRGQRPRILILAGSRVAGAETAAALATELAEFEANGGRVVFISQEPGPFDAVLLANRDGARALATALAERGYRAPAVITGQVSLLTARDRLDGFTEGMAAAGVAIDPARVYRAEFTRDGGYDAAQRMIAAGLDDIDMVFAVNDVMAVGAMSALRDAGIRVPEQVAVAGYDDIQAVRDVTPPLTTVRVPLEEVGRQALALALADRTPGAAPASTAIGSTVVLRESTPAR